MTSSRRPIPLAVLALIVASALGLTACGDSDSDSTSTSGSGDAAEVASVAQRFTEAGASGDYKTLCSLLTEEGQAPIAALGAKFGAKGLDCQEALEAIGATPEDAGEIEVGTPSVKNGTASVSVTNAIPNGEPVTRTLKLEQQPSGEWLVSEYSGTPG